MSDLIQARDYWIKRAERAERYIQTQSQSIEDLRVDLARRDDLIKRLVEDGERLAGAHIVKYNSGNWECNLCEHGFYRTLETIEHDDKCPVALHRALMKEVEG